MSGKEQMDYTNTGDPITEEERLEMTSEKVLLRRVVAECLIIIFKAGLVEHLSDEARTLLAQSRELQELVERGEGPNLSMRMTTHEYINHLMQIMDVHQSQAEFLSFIVRVCYIMMITEKNPAIAAELRGANQISQVMKGILG